MDVRCVPIIPSFQSLCQDPRSPLFLNGPSSRPSVPLPVIFPTAGHINWQLCPWQTYSLFSVTGITKKTPAVSSKISTVVPAIKPVPGTSSRYLVLGSFRNRLNADAFSKQLGAFKAFVATVQLPSGTYYRVLAGPSSGESLESLKSRYIQATGAESWVVTLSQPMPSKTAVLR